MRRAKRSAFKIVFPRDAAHKAVCSSPTLFRCGKPPFVSVFHTGFFAPVVCGKLPGVRFQIGEKQTRKPE